MANINLIQNTAGVNASGGRQMLASNSWTRFDVTFITPDGDEFNIPAGSNIVGELNKQALAKGIKTNAVDFLGQFEKAYNMKLKDAELLDSKARNAKVGAPELEYDNLVISMDSQASSDPDIAKQINDIIIDELRSVKCALTDDKTGYEGKRPIFVSDEHTNTGNKHTHIIVHRFGQGVDPLTKRPYMSTGVMMDSNSVMATLEKRINDRLNVAGLTQFTFSATGSNTRVADNNEISKVAKAVTEELIIAAGGAINTATVVVPEAKLMQAQSILFKSEAEELNRQIEKIRMQAVAKIEAASKLDQAIQVMTENDQLKTNLKTVQGELEATNTELAATKEQAEQTISEKQLQINFVGDALSSFAPEFAEQMRAGDTTVINGTLKTVTGRLSDLDEAFDQLPDDIAKKLRANPFEEFQNIVENLESQKSAVVELILKIEQAISNNTELTTKNETLTVSTNTLTKQNSELEARITKHDADMTVIVDKLQKAEAERKAFETDLYKAQARLETKDDEITELKAKNTAVEAERKNFESQLYKAEAQIQSKETLITDLQSKANATESKIKALENELVETSKQAKEINELRAKNSELQKEVEKKVTGSVLDADQRKLLAFLEANPATKTTVSNLVNQTIKTQNDLTGNGNTDNDMR